LLNKTLLSFNKLTDISKFKKIISEIKELEKLHWKDPKTSVWIDKVLRFLKTEFGEESDYYRQFYNRTYKRPVIVVGGTPDHQFQSEYLERLDEYRKHLKAILVEVQEDEPVKESKFPSELKLHPKIITVSEKLFHDRHYSPAIFEAVKVLEKEIKHKSKIKDKIGVDLVNHVFNKDHPIIKIVKGSEQEQIDEREGFRFLYMGAFLGIKNPKSHSIQHLEDSSKALQYLSFLSLLMKRLDESSID
jgi:uncharacterized protein (TIGR02391 family)